MPEVDQGEIIRIIAPLRRLVQVAEAQLDLARGLDLLEVVGERDLRVPEPAGGESVEGVL